MALKRGHCDHFIFCTTEVFNMEINQNMLNSLLSLSDAELQEKIRLIAVSLGMNSTIANIQTANVGKLRTTLTNTGVDELNRMLASFDSAEAKAILKNLETGGMTK